jgi:dolichol-phosphate mannosyltransferase
VSRDDVLVVVPTLNERENLDELVRGIRTALPDAHLLIVDDGSTDGTTEAAAAFGVERGDVHLLARGRKLGIGSAYRDGLGWGLARRYQRFVTMDGDLSHDPRYLPELVGAVGDDVDVAVGSRYLHGVSVVNWSLQRLAMSVLANRYARLVTGLPVRDCTSGFQCFRRAVLETIAPSTLRCDNYAFLVELKFRAHRAGFRFHEVPIIFVDRRFGFSKLGYRHVAQSTLAVWAMRFGRR